MTEKKDSTGEQAPEMPDARDWQDAQQQIRGWLRNPSAKPIVIGRRGENVMISPPLPGELGDSDVEHLQNKSEEAWFSKRKNKPIVYAARELATWRKRQSTRRTIAPTTGVSAKVDATTPLGELEAEEELSWFKHRTAEGRYISLEHLKPATLWECRHRYRGYVGREFEPADPFFVKMKANAPRGEYELEERARTALIQLSDAINKIHQIAREVRSGPIAIPLAHPDDPPRHLDDFEHVTGGPCAHYVARVIDPAISLVTELSWLAMMNDKALDTARIDATALPGKDGGKQYLAYYWPMQRALWTELIPAVASSADADVQLRAMRKVRAPGPADPTELAVIWILMGNWPDSTIPPDGWTPAQLIDSAAQAFSDRKGAIPKAEKVVENLDRMRGR